MPCRLTFISKNPHLSNVVKLVKHFPTPKKRKFDREHSRSQEETEKETHPSKKLKDFSVAEDVICMRRMEMIRIRWRLVISKEMNHNQTNTGSPLKGKCLPSWIKKQL